MAEIWMTVDTALSEVPVNIAPLIDDTDFKTVEDAVAYNASGMDLRWNFVTTGGAYTSTAVTPTTAGTYDWTHQGDGMYSIEIPASGGASINNDTEGFGWFSGKVTGVLPWRGPIIGFRSAMLNDSLVNGGDFLQVDAVQFSSSTTAADNAEVVFSTDFATNYNTTTDTWSVKLANSVTHGGNAALLELGSTTTTPAFLVANSGGDAARFVSTGGNGDGFHTEGAGNGAGFHVIGTGTAGSAYFETGNIICDGTIASSITGNITGNLSGSVGSVTGAVGSVTGAVGSVTGNVGGNVVGSVASVTGNVGGNVTGSVGSVVGAVGSVTGAVGSVTGNVGGNVTGSVGSVAAGGITASSIATGAVDADALAADAVAEIADGVWDEVLTAATHNVANSAGRRLRNLGAFVVEDGTAQAGATATITLAAGASASDQFYNLDVVSIVDGTGAGQSRLIINYNGTTKVASVYRDWNVTPDNTSVYVIEGKTELLARETGIAQAGGANSITLASTASAVSDQYIGETIIILTGTGAGQARVITSYNGTTKVASVTDAWATNPDSTSTYAILPLGRAYVIDLDTDSVNKVQNGLALEATAQSILTDTAEIGAAGAGLTALATQASVDTKPTLAQILAGGDVDGYTLEQTLKLCLAGLAGKLSGAATTTITIRAADDSKDRITATVDADGNRSVVTLDATG